MKKTLPISFLGVFLMLFAFADQAEAYYNPGSGRFINRDPIGERGGENLHAFVRNDGVNRLDYLGGKPIPGVGIKAPVNVGPFGGGGDDFGADWNDPGGAAVGVNKNVRPWVATVAIDLSVKLDSWCACACLLEKALGRTSEECEDFFAHDGLAQTSALGGKVTIGAVTTEAGPTRRVAIDKADASATDLANGAIPHCFKLKAKLKQRVITAEQLPAGAPQPAINPQPVLGPFA